MRRSPFIQFKKCPPHPPLPRFPFSAGEEILLRWRRNPSPAEKAKKREYENASHFLKKVAQKLFIDYNILAKSV